MNEMQDDNRLISPEISWVKTNQLLKYYEAFFVDVWGVIHDGINPYPNSIACLNHILSLGKKIIFLSNIPRPGNLTYQKLLGYGIHCSTEMVLTSGDIVRHQLIHFDDSVFKILEKKGKGRCFYHLGAARNHDILSGLKVDVTENLEEASFILLTAYLDEDEDLNQYNALFHKALMLDLPMVCANPDKILLNGNKRRYCAGVLAEQYQTLGGMVYYYGKPYPAIYEIAIEKMNEWGINDKKKIVMIGDTLETDILGARNVGIDSALVLTGNATLDQVAKTILMPNWILSALETL